MPTIMGDVQSYVARNKGTLHYVHGATDTEDRESVREIVEKSTNNVILHHTEHSLQC